MKTIHSTLLLIIFALLPILYAHEEEPQHKIYVKASGGLWPTYLLTRMADVYGIPVAVESLGFDEDRFRDYEILLNLPFDETDPGAGIQLLYNEIVAVTKTDDYTITTLTDDMQRWGPPHTIFSRIVPQTLVDLTGEVRDLSVIARAMDQELAREGRSENIIVLDQVQKIIPEFREGIQPTYLDMLRIWSGELREKSQRNLNWYLLPLPPGRRNTHDIRFGVTGSAGHMGASLLPNEDGSRWICHVVSYHPLLGALELTQAMNESQVDFYVYSLPEAVNKEQEGVSPRAPGVVFGPHGGGEVTSLKKWGVRGSGLATGDSLSEIVNAARRSTIPIQTVKHEAGNEVRVNASPDLLAVSYDAREVLASEKVSNYLEQTLRRHWPDITLDIGATAPITDNERRVPDTSTAQTVGEMLVHLVPPDVKGTWSIIEGLDRVYTLSFRPMGEVTELPGR